MTSDSPLVSIVVTSYNYAHYIGQTIGSVLAQTYDNWELIISDDGSTDNSLEVIRSFTDPRITIIASETNEGGASAYAKAYALCHGKYFTSLDSDDYIVPSKLERQVQYLEEHPDVDILGTFVLEVDGSGESIGDEGVHQMWFNQKIDLNQPDGWLWQNHLCHSSALIRKAFHDRVGLTNPNLPYAGDYEFWVKCLVAGGHFHLLPEKLTYYRAHGGNVTHKNPDRALLESAYIFGAYLKPYLFKISRQDLVYKSIAEFLMHHETYLKASKELKATILKILLPIETGPQDFELFSEDIQSSPSTEFLTITEVLDTVLVALQESTKLCERQQRWIAELEKGKAWLEEEWQKWQHVATERQAAIEQQQVWITELEKGKAWLEEEWQKWQHVATERQAAIEQQQVWITELEKGKAWLEEERQKWQHVATEQQTLIQQQHITIGQQQAAIQRLDEYLTRLRRKPLIRFGQYFGLLGRNG
jgi:glycosyltransferase involved in cell wall biosynthesis